ncbi:MAG TPA: Holliday junction branch migration protein RuvA [Chloroflexota bacterium]|nr:Holliday junction branch migration protein RuvA [Chloroflexota bacterium]
MIAAVTGLLEATQTDAVLVQVGGFTLRVFAPTSTISRLPAVGQAVRLYTHFYLREDVIALYGFLTADELSLFEQLLTVSGVGPRVALAMLSAASAETLRGAIASESVETLTRLPGIGKKLAARLILELRGKLTAPEGVPATPTAPADVEVIEALVGLGYTPADAQAALKSLPAGLELEEKIRRALRYFAR